MASLTAAPFDNPILQHLNIDAATVDISSPLEQAKTWLTAFETTILNHDLDSVINLFHEHGFWKDILTLTWDFRTIRGHPAIRQLLDTRLAATGLSAFHLHEDAIRRPMVMKPLPDLILIRFCFDFETIHGKGTAVGFLVPASSGDWKAWSLFTCLGALKDYPEKAGALREILTDRDNWYDRRQREINFEDGDPTVLVIGAGHVGLQIAARLTHLGVPTLVVERNKRVGDNWRKHYNSLSLHNPVWFNQMPYLDYPKTFPVFCPAPKLGDWLEHYATSLDLNVWVSSSVTSTSFDQEKRTWHVSIDRDGKTRTMTVKHLVFATGWGGGFGKIPDIPGKESYRGHVLHSTQFASSMYQGKKVVVVGAGTSAHDIARDLYHHGCDITMVQRSPTLVVSRDSLAFSLRDMHNEHFPLNVADMLSDALPFVTKKYLLRASTARTTSGRDKELLDNLEKVGFRTWRGPHDAGLLPLVLERGGGMYVDSGASKEIINGSIKVKGSPSIRRFTEDGVELEDGTVLEGDVVIFATGFGNNHAPIAQVCGDDVAAKVGKIWGLDAEGEVQGAWRKTGHPRLWVGMGNFAQSRAHSLHLALHIKAIEEGIVQEPESYIS